MVPLLKWLHPRADGSQGATVAAGCPYHPRTVSKNVFFQTLVIFLSHSETEHPMKASKVLKTSFLRVLLHGFLSLNNSVIIS